MSINFDITKLWLGAKSKKAFDVATEFTFNTKLLIAICKDKVTVQKNNQFQVSQSADLPESIPWDVNTLNDLTVLDCEPVHCGVLTVNTQFVVVDISDKNKVADNLTKSVEPLYLSDFTSALTVEDVGAFLSSPSMKDQPLRVHQFIKVQALTGPKHLNDLEQSDSNDENYTIYVPKVLARKHRLFNNCLLECMSVNTFSSLQTQPSRLGKVNGCIQNTVESKPKSKKKRNPAVAVIQIFENSAGANNCVYTTPCFLYNALRSKETSEHAEVVLRVSIHSLIVHDIWHDFIFQSCNLHVFRYCSNSLQVEVPDGCVV